MPKTPTTDVVEPTAMDDLRKLIGAIPDGVEDAAKVSEDIANRIGAATTVAEVFGLASNAAESARDYVNIPLVLLEIRWNKSDLADSAVGGYAMMSCADTQGNQHVISCGANTVLVLLLQLMKLDALPQPVIIRESYKPTASGYRPMHLEDGSEAFAKGF